VSVTVPIIEWAGLIPVLIILGAGVLGVLVEALTALRGWGMVLAAPAMTAASFASVLALPGVRSAMRRIDSPGR